jgi:hypothetical protein
VRGARWLRQADIAGTNARTSWVHSVARAGFGRGLLPPAGLEDARRRPPPAVTVDLAARPDERRVGEAIEDAARRAEGMSEEVVSVVVSVSAKESKLSAPH